MTMTSRYAGTCKTCKAAMPVGTLIQWVKGAGARHADFALCQNIGGAANASVMPAPPPVVLPISPVASFINAAQARGLRFPKMRFLAPDGRSELRLYVAGPRSNVPGAINVLVAGNWIGRIGTDGIVSLGLSRRRDLLDTLTIIAADPAAAAKAYGAFMSRCSFCHLALTDEGSVECGYGATCAKHYGLPHYTFGVPKVGIVHAPPSTALVTFGAAQ